MNREGSNKLLSEKEVAKMLGVTLFMVRKMRLKKGLPYIQAGTRIFYREQSVYCWLEEQETKIS